MIATQTRQKKDTLMTHLAPLKVFIDTEFTDFLDTELISVGMAADSGQEFYGEVPFDDSKCSQFVREGVLKLLGQVPHAHYASLADLAGAIITWLEEIRQGEQVVEICVDAQIDWDLFSDVLDYHVPPWVTRLNVSRNINKLLSYEYHVKNGVPHHHALHDAKANRYAYRDRIQVTRQ